jgi:SpoVK/Ycf46/Vps4 family AAA+-type ATPase
MASPTSTDNALMELLRTITNGPTVAGGGADWTKIDTPLAYEGKQITLPADPVNMPIPTAIDTLHRIEKQENQEFDVNEVVSAAPWDALVALYRAMQDIYGVVLAESRQTFFGEVKPDFITVKTGHGPKDNVQVPMGQMSLPGVSKPVNIGIFHGGAYINGTVRKRDRARLIEIGNRAKQYIAEQSVYRGKAIRIGVDGEGNLELSKQPEFLNLTKVQVSDMIHTAETNSLIKTNIFSPLLHTEACRLNNIPLKRGILLEGRYGTGKSLTARVTAKVATDNGWTFIILDRAQGLKAAIELARIYQPCVIFAEDIDRAADREEEGVNDLVNLIDGVISKDMEVMTILTTNFIEKIDQSLLRPGRFDAVISIQVPDAETAERLIRAYAGNLLDPNEDISRVGETVAGQIPATIREVVERAKLSMLMETRTYLNESDLFTSAIGMKRHMELLLPPNKDKSPADVLYNALAGVFAKALEDDTGESVATSAGVIRQTERVLTGIRRTREGVEAATLNAHNAFGSAAKAVDDIKKLDQKIDGKKVAF